MSRTLIDIPIFHDWVGLVCEEMLPASIHCVNAMRKWPGSTDPAHTGFALSNGIENDFFDELKKDPTRATRFANGMNLNHSAPALNLTFLADNVPWKASLSPGSVIDISGSHRATGIEILIRFPDIVEYVVQDLPDVIAGACIPDEVAGRLKFQEYDSFTEQCSKEADVYLLRFMLLDWPDAKAIAILRNQVAAMKPDSRMILNEICLPNPGVLTNYQEQFLRGFDLSMKHVFNGKERDIGEWTALIEEVDSRLHIGQIVQLPGSLLAIIEVLFK